MDVICFEPGIAKREGETSRFVKNKCVTLRAEMGDNKPAVVYALEGNGARPSHRGVGYSEDGRMFTLNTVDRHCVCYQAEDEVQEEISDVFVFKECFGCEVGGGKGILVAKNTAFTVATLPDFHVCYGISKACLQGGATLMGECL